MKSSNVQLGNEVFDNCQSLKRINGKSFELIPPKTFHFCKSLAIIELSPNLRGIGKDAFWGCSNLKSVTIPNSITSIGEDAFHDCGNLKIFGQKGSAAQKYANENNIKLTVFLPQYERYGRAAPIVRNKKIVDYADKIIVFWNASSKGTLSVIKYAKKIGKPCEVIICK